jgi:V/A-type H+-transporting ATPase subunit A
MDSVAHDWRELRDKTMFLLQKEVELQEIVQLVGPDALPESEKAILEVTRMVREDFLQQSAFDEIDSFCPLEKQYWMLKVILTFHDAITDALGKGVSLQQLLDLPVKTDIARMKGQEDVSAVKGLIDKIEGSVGSLEVAK